MIPVKTIMTTDVITVKPETPIIEAMQLLKKHHISGMPVVDDECRIRGILTEKDVLRILLNRDLIYQETVADYMVKDVVCFAEEDSVIEVCKFFLKSPVRRVPIAKEGKLIGIVSRPDIISLILEIKDTISGHRFH